MKFISTTSPSYAATWKRTGLHNGLFIAGQLVLVSEVPPVPFYRVQLEVRLYEYRPLYQGTNLADAKRVQSEAKDQSNVKSTVSMGLPDFMFSIDRSMGDPTYVTAHENDANGCIFEASVLGSHGFKATCEGEILAEYRTEGKTPGEQSTWFTTMSVLLPGQSLLIEYSRRNGENPRSKYLWDGRLLTQESLGGLAKSPSSASPWGELDKLQIK